MTGFSAGVQEQAEPNKASTRERLKSIDTFRGLDYLYSFLYCLMLNNIVGSCT